MSSDSEDDCYGNIAQKLHSIKSRYIEDKIETSDLYGDSTPISSLKNCDKPIEIDVDDQPEQSNTTINSLDGEDDILDIIIATNSKRKRGRKPKSKTSDISTENILPERASKRKRGRPAAKSPRNTQNSVQSDENTTNTTNATTTPNQSADASTLLDTSLNTSGNSSGRSGRGRGRARGRSRGSNTSSRASNTPRRNRRQRGWFPSVPTQFSNMNPTYPIYSVGNTDEYPDECDNQALFSKPTTKSNDVEIIDDAETEIDNEELSVKVYWQNIELVKFDIRKYQKISTIFEFFAKRENVTQDKLFFTYNDQILKSYDTPDSINYSIAKFIDGGIVNQNVSNIVKSSDSIKDGIVIKFQCQSKKVPFVTNVAKEEPLLLAMTKCAENLEQPVTKLKFYFDGDLITGKNTPSELELEGGECIDVKIIS